MFVSEKSMRVLYDLADDWRSLKAVRLGQILKRGECSSQTSDGSDEEEEELAILPEMREVGLRGSDSGV